MKAKKTKKADLKNKQNLFLQVGFLVALGIVFAAFQWSVEEPKSIVLTGGTIIDYEDVLIPITRPDKPETKEAPKPQIVAVIDIVDSGTEIDADFDFTSEVFEDIPVSIIPYEPEEEEIIEEVLYGCDLMPVFPGGMPGLQKFIANHLNYPEIAIENNVQGTVFVQFVVNKMGKVTNIILLKGADPLLNKEALAVVQQLPEWSAGMQAGQLVNVAFTVPIKFRLN